MREGNPGVADNRQQTRKRKRDKRRKRRHDSSIKQTSNSADSKPSVSSPDEKLSAKTKRTSSFLDKMRARLSGGHFRMLNEKLYTCSGAEALDYFKGDPELFDVYHAGYQEQMTHWPEQPVNIITRWLKDHSPSLVVADFGCGDARLARNVKNKVYSLDLISRDPSVIACDMSNTPLDSSSVDVAVFCLSLMGTNYPSYIQEAHRVLKPRSELQIFMCSVSFYLISNLKGVTFVLFSGWLLIAEVKSRFDPSTGGADSNKFSKAICDLGFTSVSKDFSNKMFILMYFKRKDKEKPKGKEIKWPELKPCFYKRR